jgi:hypothetical protein
VSVFLIEISLPWLLYTPTNISSRPLPPFSPPFPHLPLLPGSTATPIPYFATLGLSHRLYSPTSSSRLRPILSCVTSQSTKHL